MLKVKYLHRKYGKSERYRCIKKYKRTRQEEYLSELPLYESMTRKKYWCHLDYKPIYEFIMSKVGCDWNDVYSELITKIDPKIRYSVDHYLFSRIFMPVVFDDEFIPRLICCGYRGGRICFDMLYIDLDNIVSYNTEEQILLESRKKIRKLKIQEILENIKNSQSED